MVCYRGPALHAHTDEHRGQEKRISTYGAWTSLDLPLIVDVELTGFGMCQR